MAKKRMKVQMKPHKTKAKSRVRGGKAGPSHPGNKNMGGAGTSGMGHEKYMTP
jgi:hypothetical protein